MSAKATTVNGITLVDPNYSNTNVNQEDLMVYVKLVARVKSRSIITQGNRDEIKIEQVLQNVPEFTNYTYQAGLGPKDKITTDWTDIGGSILNGKDKGGFGITSIDIDIKSSFQPQVIINFVDIRGATLFEQGPCSPYAAFFHMPYPIFELTVKGFYGRPVTYTLALRKFNAKFNPSTGNFEVQGEFLGYTYAFLADLLMGYALAAPNMPGADSKLSGIWTRILEKRSGLQNSLPGTAITLKQMIKDIGELEKTLGELANTDEFQVISKLNVLKTETNQLKTDIDNFIRDVESIDSGVVKVDSGVSSYGNLLLKFIKKDNDEEIIKKIRTLVKSHFGDPSDSKTLGSYEVLLGIINNNPERGSNGLPELASVSSIIVEKGLYKGSSPEKKNNEEYYYIDLGYFRKQISEFNVEVDKVLKTKNENAVSYINQAVKNELGYVPTIGNVTTILMANMELFLHLLLEASWMADEQHQRQPLNPVDAKLLGDGQEGSSVVYPWPTYYDRDTNKGGDVEKFPGENTEFSEWEEVKFVEDYLKAYLELKEELSIIAGDVEGKPGFDNFIPLTPLESPLMDEVGGVKPIAYWKDKQENEIYKNIGERAFLLGDYTLLNGLTAWKARYQLGINSTPGNNVTPSLNNSFFDTRKNDSDSSYWDRITDYNLMEQYGKIDGINAVNSIVEPTMLTAIRNQIQTSKDGFKQKVIDQLTSTGKFKSLTFSDWVASDPTGVSKTKVTNQLKNIDGIVYGGLDDNTEIYTYTGNIFVGEQGSGIEIYPNPHNNQSFLILKNDPERKITLKDNLLQIPDSNSSPFSNNNAYGFKRHLTDKIQEVLQISEDKSFFKLDEKNWVPSIREDLKDNFIKFDPWADDSGKNDKINYSIGSIDTISTFITGIEFGMPWSSKGGGNSRGTCDALIQTPLWAKNLPTSKNYRRSINYDNGKVKGGTYYVTSQKGLHSNSDTSYKALAYLALINLGWADQYDEGFGGWYDRHNTKEAPQHSVLPFFRITGGSGKIPKGFVLVTGAVLWRLKESGYLNEGGNGIAPSNNDGDPIKWWTTSGVQTTSTIKGGTVPSNSGLQTSITSNNTPTLKGFKKLEPYHWPHVILSGSGYDTKSFALIENGKKETWGDKAEKRTSPGGDSSREYVDIREKMKSLLLLPDDIKNSFISEFENWALGEWKSKYIVAFDPLHFGSTENLLDLYSVAGETNPVVYYRVGPKNGLGDDNKNNTVLEEMYNEMYTSYFTLVYSTPKAFSAIHKNDFSNSFNIRKIELDKFLDGWMDGFESTVDNKLQAKVDGEDANELSGENALNDPDIKLSLYKSFKSLFDKWISTSNKANDKYELFYNNVSNISEKDRLLIDHFEFVDRGHNDIGDKSVVDVTYLKNMADNPTSSIYQTMTELLSKNGFDFFPLPNFVTYGKDDASRKALEEMFEPITNLNSIENSPSFICMYIGGSSKNLSLGKQASAFCSSNQEILYRYEDDSISDLLNTDAENLQSGNVTAFLVDFGIENQSHFTSISLNQAEFKETQESLMVIDQLSKGGNENNRVAKGQNLYNVYQTRSYTCEVETLGNLQIQPMMYFQLNHVPMFHGSYMITEVRHSVKPHHVTTTFKGTRIPKISVPLVTDAYSTMVLGQTDLSKSAGSTSSYLNSLGGYGSGGSGSGGSGSGGGGGTRGSKAPIVRTIIENGGLNGNIEAGNIFLKEIPKIEGVKNLKAGSSSENKLLFVAVDPLVEMLNDWIKWMKDNGFAGAEGKGKNYVYINSVFRTYDDQVRVKNQYGSAAATPGTSPHGWGIAVDFQMFKKDGTMIPNTKSTPKYFDTEFNPAIKWLYDNSYKYGWVSPIGLRDGSGLDEHWHWEYHGTAAVCLVKKDPVVYGYTINTDVGQKDIVKNPKKKDGQRATYTDCDYKSVGGDGTSSSTGGEGDPNKKSTKTSDTTKSANQVKIKEILKNKGYSKQVVAGIMGNIMKESAFNPLIINPKDSNGFPSVGLIQWNGKYIPSLNAGSNPDTVLNTVGRTVEAQMSYLFTNGPRWKSFIENTKDVLYSNDAAFNFASIVEKCGGCLKYDDYKNPSFQQFDRSQYAADFMERFKDKNDPLYWK